LERRLALLATLAGAGSGLAIQSLAIGIEVVKRYREGANADRFSGVVTIEIG
jgi:hypothetical protein